MFVIHSHKALGNNLGRLLRNSYAEWISSDYINDDSFFKSIISKDEVDFLKETPETLLEILVNPETTPNFGIYIEMKLGIVSYAPNFISQCLSLNAHKA